ncbi:hypothetical protein [Chamaesiphon minutus]|uniref:Uncharacterized protein n=1 Tax=Chamaesiphon minutus (strain ATCC 27169 / PCC 6605) TaxID=1173020 RepID=K9UQQ0_CHAP6|nr:hypothetical protein [Chamaesiphon minutus]AFY97130.1 hypothetical protein Cha6605_6306 [Chamaesiphon minutus PCC 6605]
MTKYNHHKHNPKSSLLDRVYYSCSVEFWLSIVTVGIAADWIFKLGVNSLLITLAWTGTLGTYLIFSNRIAGDLWYKFRSIKAPQHLLLLVAGISILGSLFLITCITDTAHALILTNSGEQQIKDLISGKDVGVSNSSLAGFGTMIVNLIKVSFGIACVFGIKHAYDKYRERAEIQEIVEAPVILIIAVSAVDGIMGAIFKTA